MTDRLLPPRRRNPQPTAAEPQQEIIEAEKTIVLIARSPARIREPSIGFLH